MVQKKEKKVINKYGYLMAGIGLAVLVLSFFSEGASRNLFFILGVIIIIVGVAMALSVDPVKKK